MPKDTTISPTTQTLTEQALHAADQCMTDVLTLYRSLHTSGMVMDVAMFDMKSDALTLVRAARQALPSPEDRAFKADLLARAEKAEAKLATLRAMATRAVPNCVNLYTIDRILAE